MQESYVVNLDTPVLLVLIVLHTLAPEAVKFGWIQRKQICSFDDGDTHTRSIDLVGVESAHSAIEVKDSQRKPETPNASHATLHFWREMQM